MNVQLPDLSIFLKAFLLALPSVIIIIAIALIVNYFIGKALTLFAHKTRFTEQDVSPLRRVISWLITSASVVLVLGAFGLNLGGLWGILSTILAMVAIGFVAVWSVLSNTLCTLIILIFRPFSVGDEVEFPGEPVKGRVHDLNFIYTTLESEDGSMLQVPNNLFFQRVLRRRPGAAVVSLSQQLKSKARESAVDPRESGARI